MDTRKKVMKKIQHKLEIADVIFARIEYNSKIESQNINLFLELKNEGKDFIFKDSPPSLKKQIL